MVVPSSTLRSELLAGRRLTVVESCNSSWLFDEEHRTYLRAARGSRLDLAAMTDGWQAYHRVEVSEAAGTLLLLLNRDGTQLIEATLHLPGCDCEGPLTAELSLEAVRDHEG